MASNETLIREEKNTFLGKSIVGTNLALQILECSPEHLDKLCRERLINYSKPIVTNTKGQKVEGRKRYFKVNDLYEYMISNLSEKL